MNPICKTCGGSGDAWDKSLDDWASPRRDCGACNGYGEAAAAQAEERPPIPLEKWLAAMVIEGELANEIEPAK